MAEQLLRRYELDHLIRGRAWAACKSLQAMGADVHITQVRTGRVHGPTAIPAYSAFDSTREMVPNQPGLYGRYLVIDLTQNNRASIDIWCERNPDRPRPDLGWGVCRHGFGLQNFGDGYMTQEVAEARAKALNQGRPATDIPNTEN